MAIFKDRDPGPLNFKPPIAWYDRCYCGHPRMTHGAAGCDAFCPDSCHLFRFNESAHTVDARMTARIKHGELPNGEESGA